MNTQQVVGAIQQKFNAALQSKTGWGRNELVLLHSNIIVEVLAQAIDERPLAGMDIPMIETKPQDKYDSIIFEHAHVDEFTEAGFDTEMYDELWSKDMIRAKDFHDASGDR